MFDESREHDSFGFVGTTGKCQHNDVFGSLPGEKWDGLGSRTRLHYQSVPSH